MREVIKFSSHGCINCILCKLEFFKWRVTLSWSIKITGFYNNVTSSWIMKGQIYVYENISPREILLKLVSSLYCNRAIKLLNLNDDVPTGLITQRQIYVIAISMVVD